VKPDFFAEADAKFFASLGLNCIRIPFNYRHFEDDMNPRVLKESGFKHLDRVIDLVCFPLVSAALEVSEGTYAILSHLSACYFMLYFLIPFHFFCFLFPSLSFPSPFCLPP